MGNNITTGQELKLEMDNNITTDQELKLKMDNNIPRAFHKSFWSDFPRWLPVIMLAGVYPAVVFLATGYITLFLPEAPLAARETLFNVGYKGIGLAVALTSSFSMLFNDQSWVLITWACLQSILIAAILAFWVCLVCAYGKQGATGTKS
ncbi:hypothetical protein SETIT_9G000600v2 [Setaria italica]|uniref:DUF7378 domain-containing protein n=1 Tax=Setaria italica TaxID=4555 RepID=A0A368SBL0_SETIT|nr:hypothetical protein SETIT_9G000600v2 [Setaria italica]